MRKLRIITILLSVLLILASCSDNNVFRIDGAVCRVNGKGYVSIQSAIDAITGVKTRGVGGSSYTIEVIKDINYEIREENRNGINIPQSFNGNIIIDFKGYEMRTTESFIVSGGKLTIKNGDILKVGTGGFSIEVKDASLSIEDTSIVGNTDFRVTSNSSLSLSSDDISGNFYLDKNCSLEVDGGTVSFKDIIDLDSEVKGEITIKSGTIKVVHDWETRIRNIVEGLPESERDGVSIVIIHDLETIGYVAPECTTDGNIQYYECNVCHKLFTDIGATNEIEEEDTVLEALGHNITHVEAKAATCEMPGNEEHWYCSRCWLYSFSSDLSSTAMYSDIYCYPALGHDLPEEWTIIKEATCSETGTKTKACRREGCGVVLSETIPTLEHNLSVWITDGNFHWKVCSICKNIVNKYPHNFGEWVKNPKEGTQTKICNDCGKEVTEVYHELVLVTKKDATCTEEGNIAYYKCTVHDDEYFRDTTMSNKLTLSQTIIPALGHIESDSYTISDDKHSILCKRCGIELESAVHSWVCHTDSLNHEFHTSTCTVCGRVDMLRKYASNDDYHWEICPLFDWKSSKENIHYYGSDGTCIICGHIKPSTV